MRTNLRSVITFLRNHLGNRIIFLFAWNERSAREAFFECTNGHERDFARAPPISLRMLELSGREPANIVRELAECFKAELISEKDFLMPFYGDPKEVIAVATELGNQLVAALSPQCELVVSPNMLHNLRHGDMLEVEISPTGKWVRLTLSTGSI
ncbi:hypothetical protein KBD61_00370 [Patescibacteria group bacterium]|nr:hypothetical protein [Patescibacteria group bacterium]